MAQVWSVLVGIGGYNIGLKGQNDGPQAWIGILWFRFWPFCLDLGHCVFIWPILFWFWLHCLDLGYLADLGKRGPKEKPWGWAGGGWGKCTDGRTDRFPLYSTGLCPLRGRCPAPSQPSSSRARVPLTTYCLWAAIERCSCRYTYQNIWIEICLCFNRH